MFDTTVKENIALNNPEATSEEIIAAARVAYAHDFIMTLPMGYNTRVGEGGSALSGGQRQRMAIARTVLQNPQLLIMDEATSALDYNSERQVCQNLQQALKGRTVFFITHRLSTIRHADVILMMEDGRINEDTFPTVSIPTQFISLTRSRAVLIAENRMFQAQMDGNTEAMTLTAQQQQRVTSELEELTSRVTGAELEIEQLQKQYSQADIRLAANEKKLNVNEKILQDISELAQEGGISRIQFLNQQQEVDSIRAEIAQLQEEKIRLQAAIAQAQAKVQNTKAIDRRDLTTRIGNNSQRIAEIDSQLTKAVIDNKKRIAEIDSQLSQTNQALRYSVVRSPVDGVVFDLKANAPGFVAKSTEPVLKIVPQTDLVAKVSITNKDIGFIREGMHVDVRIDSFPYSEFGDIKGTLTWIGSDTLPPTQLQPYYTFPATVTLDQQYLNSKGRKIPLQSGMSLNGNIKIRERTVMSIFTDFFSKTGESLKFVR